MAAPPGEHKLFIGALPSDVTEEELKIVFSTYGEVTNMHVMRNSKAPTGHLSAFVSYAAKQSGDDAIQVLHEQYKIRAGEDQQAIKVSWARSGGEKGFGKGDMGAPMGAPPGSSEHKLFVGGLPPGITEDELRIVFSTYGEVVSLHVMHTTKSQTGHISGFVTYKNKQSGDDAIQVLNGQYRIRAEEAQPINVSWARSGGDKGKGFDKGYDKGYGKGAWGPPPAWDKGYGGYDKGWDKGWGGKGYGGWDKGGWDKGWGGKGGWDGGGKPSWDGGKGKDGGKGPPPGNRLFVGNLPGDIDEASIKYVFGNYGAVTHTHIMVGKSQTGQSCAFIEFATNTEADTAIATLHEKYEIRQGEGPIIVRHANSRGRSNGPY